MNMSKDDLNWFEVSSLDLDPQSVTEWVTSSSTGATTLFVGTTRDHSEDRPGVIELEYEAYEEAVLVSFNELSIAAREKWPDLERIAMLHRTGVVAVKGIAVIVAVSAAHRTNVFTACDFLIRELKKSSPIWKKETWSGGSAWVDHC